MEAVFAVIGEATAALQAAPPGASRAQAEAVHFNRLRAAALTRRFGEEWAGGGKREGVEGEGEEVFFFSQ